MRRITRQLNSIAAKVDIDRSEFVAQIIVCKQARLSATGRKQAFANDPQQMRHSKTFNDALSFFSDMTSNELFLTLKYSILWNRHRQVMEDCSYGLLNRHFSGVDYEMF